MSRRCSTVCERSGSYSVRTLACMTASVAPRLAGCSGLPSIFVGRPRWLSTSTPVAMPAVAHRRRVEQRFARNHFLRLAHIGNNRFLRLLGAGRGAGQRDGGAHQRQKSAARGRIVPVRRAVRETHPRRRLGTRRSRRALPDFASIAAAVPLKRRRSSSRLVCPYLPVTSHTVRQTLNLVFRHQPLSQFFLIVGILDRRC